MLITNSAATNIKTIYQTHINKMWDLIMELYEYFFYLKSIQECSHPQSTLFFMEIQENWCKINSIPLGLGDMPSLQEQMSFRSRFRNKTENGDIKFILLFSLVSIILFGVGLVIGNFFYTGFRVKSSEEVKAELMKDMEKRAKEKEAEVNDWYANSSQYSCETRLKQKLRDPNSYERAEEFVVSPVSQNEKVITWKFRSKN